jgi:Flp pilus assembly protein protease CpaA
MQPLLDILSVLTALAGCFLALRSDLATGKIPNRLTNNMLVASFILMMLRVFSGDSSYVWPYLLNFAAGFVIGFVFWYVQAWSGGDAKIFWAIASLIPVYPPVLEEILGMSQPYYSSYVFAITVLFNMGLLLLIRFLFMGIIKFLKEGKIMGAFRLTTSPMIYISSSSLIGTGLAAWAGIPALIYLSWPVIFLLSAVERSSYKKFLVSSALIAVLGFAALSLSSKQDYAFGLLSNRQTLGIAFLLSAYAAGSRIPFTNKTAIKDLKKGMSVAEEVYVVNGSLVREEVNPSLLYSLLSILKPKKDYIVRPAPAGLSEKDIDAIMRHEVDLEGFLRTNQSFLLMPYITAALLLSLYADFLWAILS